MTADVLAYLAEVDARRLYAPAGYSTMRDYWMGELHLSEDAAVHRSKAEIQRLLADRFPQSEMLGLVEVLPAALPAQRGKLPSESEAVSEDSAAGAGALNGPLAPAQVQTLVERAAVKPLAPQCFALQATISQGAYEKFQHIQALLSHQIPSGDVAEVLEFTFDAAIEKLEKRNDAAASQSAAPDYGRSVHSSGRQAHRVEAR
jgi:hypothetical protein